MSQNINNTHKHTQKLSHTAQSYNPTQMFKYYINEKKTRIWHQNKVQKEITKFQTDNF